MIKKVAIIVSSRGRNLIPICIQDGDRGGSEEPTQAYPGVRRGERRSDNEGIHLKANRYKILEQGSE